MSEKPQLKYRKDKVVRLLFHRTGLLRADALKDTVLEKLILYMDDCITQERDIVEMDRWTIWKAVK